MSEIDASPKNPEIPESWNFPQREDPRLDIVQLDIDERFIAYTLSDSRFPDPKSRESKYFIENSGDYFFGDDGNPSRIREQHEHEAIISLTEDSSVMYSIRNNYDHQRVFVDFLPNAPKDEDLVPYSLGAIDYENGRLSRLTLGELFTTTNDADSLIKSPSIRLESMSSYAVYGGSLTGGIDFSIQKNSNFRIQRKEEGNEASIFDANNEEVFKVKFQTEQADTGESFFVVSQTHIPTGIEKILKAPFSIDPKRSADAAFSKPPYKREPKLGKDKLVVPWTNIGHIVDARLIYSPPPPQKP